MREKVGAYLSHDTAGVVLLYLGFTFKPPVKFQPFGFDTPASKATTARTDTPARSVSLEPFSFDDGSFSFGSEQKDSKEPAAAGLGAFSFDSSFVAPASTAATISKRTKAASTRPLFGSARSPSASASRCAEAAASADFSFDAESSGFSFAPAPASAAAVSGSGGTDFRFDADASAAATDGDFDAANTAFEPDFPAATDFADAPAAAEDDAFALPPPPAFSFGVDFNAFQRGSRS